MEKETVRLRFHYDGGIRSVITETRQKINKIIKEIEEKIKKNQEWLLYVDKDKKKSFINLKKVRTIYEEE